MRPPQGHFNVKHQVSWIVTGAIAVGLFADSPPLHAQAPRAPSPASAANGAPSATGGDDEPWSRGVATEVQDAARAVFLEGNRLFKIPLFAQAVEKYTEALGKWEHPAFYFNLALAQLNLGQDVEAHGSLEQAMRYGAAPLGEDEFREARKQLLEIERRLGRLRISCPTPGAEVTLDGVALFTGPGSREVWVKPQAHEITAKRHAYFTKVKGVTISPGGQETLDLPLKKLIEDRPWAAWKPWAVVGSGLAVAAAGGVLHALSARDFRAYDSGFLKLSCATAGCTEPAIDAERAGLSAKLDRARTEQKLAVGGYIAGGAVVVTGALLVYLNRPRLAEQEGAGPRGAGIALAPVASGDTLGVLMTVSH
jgi:tetratricopeptide (TPR) repeat protein